LVQHLVGPDIYDRLASRFETFSDTSPLIALVYARFSEACINGHLTFLLQMMAELDTIIEVHRLSPFYVQDTPFSYTQ
jgi:hypothetical protein